MSHAEATLTVGRVTNESVGTRARHRRDALGLSLRRAAEQTGVSRPTIVKIEEDDPTADDLSVSRLMAAYARLERRYGMDAPEEVVNMLEVDLGDGRIARSTFTGTPEGVAEATARLIRELDLGKD